MKKLLIILPFAPLLFAAVAGGRLCLPTEVQSVAAAVAEIDVPQELAVGPPRRYDIAILDRDCQVWGEFSVTSVARPTVQCCDGGRQFLTFLCVIPVPHEAPSWPLPRGWFYNISEVE